MSKRLVIVIINYRTPELVVDCLASLAHEVTSLENVFAVVIDNASGDQSHLQIDQAIQEQGWSDWCEVYQENDNRGFSAGNNAGMKVHEAEFYLLLNSDTLVHPGALAHLLRSAEENPRAGLIGPQLLTSEGQLDLSVFRTPQPLSELVRGAHLSVIDRLFARHVIADEDLDEPKENTWLSFAAVLLRRETFEQVGPMDEGFFMYFEDIDYGRRVRSAGWELGYCPESVITHLGGASAVNVPGCESRRPRGPRYFYEARSRYFCKYYGLVGLWSANILWTVGKGLSLMRQVTSGRPPHSCQAEGRDIWIGSIRPLRPPSLPQKARSQ